MAWKGREQGRVRYHGEEPEGGMSMTSTHVGRGVGLAGLVTIMALGVSGCDYWPPALQAQIEQLRAETETLKAEKAKADAQVVALTNEKAALVNKVEELTKLLKTRADQVASLEQSLAAEREKVAKLSAKPTPKAPAAKKKASPGKKKR
jgi:Tfp pilus assembly protein PilO